MTARLAAGNRESLAEPGHQHVWYMSVLVVPAGDGLVKSPTANIFHVADHLDFCHSCHHVPFQNTLQGAASQRIPV